MPRQLRIEYPGAFYHVMARGDRREPIFLGDEDRELFLKTLEEACAKTGWRVHAWVLMSNHYHWVLETPEANLVSGMHWFQNAYTRRFNQRHRLWGHVFGGRYKAVIVEHEPGSANDYLAGLLDYVHLNPVRAGLVNVREGKGILSYRWSSVSSGYAIAAPKRARWLETAIGFKLSGHKDSPRGRRGLVARLERRAREEVAERCGWTVREGQTLNSTLQRGWFWGSQAFRDQMLNFLEKKLAGVRNRNYRTSAQAKQHGEAQALRLLATGLEALGVDEAALQRGGRGDLRKAALAKALDSQTTVGQHWIAEKLQMKSPANVSQQVRRFSRMPIKKLPRPIQTWLESVKIC